MDLNNLRLVQYNKMETNKTFYLVLKNRWLKELFMLDVLE